MREKREREGTLVDSWCGRNGSQLSPTSATCQIDELTGLRLLNSENSVPKSGKDYPKAWVASKQRTFGFKGPPQQSYSSLPVPDTRPCPSIPKISIENRSPTDDSDEILCQLGWMGLQSQNRDNLKQDVIILVHMSIYVLIFLTAADAILNLLFL